MKKAKFNTVLYIFHIFAFCIRKYNLMYIHEKVQITTDGVPFYSYL